MPPDPVMTMASVYKARSPQSFPGHHHFPNCLEAKHLTEDIVFRGHGRILESMPSWAIPITCAWQNLRHLRQPVLYNLRYL